jgi:hypothetical protein
MRGKSRIARKGLHPDLLSIRSAASYPYTIKGEHLSTESVYRQAQSRRQFD